MGVLKIEVAPGVWQAVGGPGPAGPQVYVGPEPPADPELDLWWDTDEDGSNSMTQALGDVRYALNTVYRYRANRAAANYALGDQSIAGAVSVIDNLGGFT